MIRLTRCHRPDHTKKYFELHLSGGDSPAHPAAPGITLKPAWVGSALPEVKLAPFQAPTARHLVRLGRGLHPCENKRLAPAKNRKRAYYDLTIASPKTISLIALLEPNHPVAKSVMQAHMAAVEAVARAAGKMIEPQNAKGAVADKWLGVMFHHTHSRERDPHLHSHLILPNVMMNTDGQWRAMQVVIAGPNRLKLELVYGHHLATRLRRLGFGPEIVMRSSGVPEIRCLHPLTRTFSKARLAVIAAARTAASERLKTGAKQRVDDGVVVTNRRSLLPRHPERTALRARQRLADRMRKPKARVSDDPAKLTHEAERWAGEISNVEYRNFIALLDALDRTNPRRQAAIVREGPPPPTREIVHQASFQIPEGTKTTSPALFRAAIVLSAGRHEWNDLLAETRAKTARRKKALARIRAENDAVSHAIAHAEIEAANLTHTALPVPAATENQVAPVVETAEGAAPVAPPEAPVTPAPETETPLTSPTNPRIGRRGR